MPTPDIRIGMRMEDVPHLEGLIAYSDVTGRLVGYELPREAMKMTRTQALDEATERIEKLFPRVNERGYAASSPEPMIRLKMIRDVAEWLIAGEDDD